MNLLDLEKFKKQSDPSNLGTEAIKLARQTAGKLGWLVQQSRPDLAFASMSLSMCQRNPSLNDLKLANKTIELAKAQHFITKYNKLKSKPNLELWAFCDAAFALLEDKTKSSLGRVIFVIDKNTLNTYILGWKAGVISRVVHEVFTAECISLTECVDEVIYFQKILTQLLGRKIPSRIFTDNRSLKDSIYSCTPVKIKSQRMAIFGIKGLIEDGIIDSIAWVNTKLQIADALTKRGVKIDLIKNLFSNGKISRTLFNEIRTCKTKTDYSL